MGAPTESISPELKAFIEAQHVFFVASAPLEAPATSTFRPKA